MTGSVSLNVQYNIPRYNISLPGKQNRGATGNMRITPGMTEVIEFVYGNVDGVPISLVGFTLRLVFWYPNTDYTHLTADSAQNVLLVKNVEVKAPYEGKCLVVLSGDDTETLNRIGRRSLRWTIFIINEDGQVFPTQITAAGERYGIAHIEDSGMPPMEIIKGLAPTK